MKGGDTMRQPADTLWRSQPRTLLKHQVCRQYLHCWMGKICQTFRNAAIVDAFAGPGAYLDGPDGSPVVIAKTFLEHSRQERFGALRLICLEMREDRRDYLADQMAALPRVPHPQWTVPPAGRVRERFRQLHAAAHQGDQGTPVLRIVDPFDYCSAPFGLIRECMRAPCDEVDVGDAAARRHVVLVQHVCDEACPLRAEALLVRVLAGHPFQLADPEGEDRVPHVDFLADDLTDPGVEHGVVELLGDGVTAGHVGDPRRQGRGHVTVIRYCLRPGIPVQLLAGPGPHRLRPGQPSEHDAILQQRRQRHRLIRYVFRDLRQQLIFACT
jgi:hypothetical protein